MADKYFYKKLPKDDFCNSKEFRDLRDDIAYTLTLNDFDEFFAFLDEDLAAQIAEQLMLEQDMDEVSSEKMEYFFSSSLEKVRRKFCEVYRRTDMSEQEEHRCYNAINKELQQLATDFAHVITGMRDERTPIEKADADRGLQIAIGHSYSLNRVFKGGAKNKDVPDSREFVYIRFEIRQEIVMRNFTDYLEFIEGRLTEGLAKCLPLAYTKAPEQREKLERQFAQMLDAVRTVHQDFYDRQVWESLPHDLTPKQEARLLAKINLHLFDLAPHMANIIIGLRELATPIQECHLKLAI